jgi:hypothetical protein
MNVLVEMNKLNIYHINQNTIMIKMMIKLLIGYSFFSMYTTYPFIMEEFRLLGIHHVHTPEQESAKNQDKVMEK